MHGGGDEPVVTGTTQAWITLTGSAPFAGCSAAADACVAYGYSGKPANTMSCTVVGTNQRTIKCQTGYVVTGTTQARITLTGSAPFAGCSAAADACVAYGYSGKPANTMSCTVGPNQRTIKCQTRYVVTGTTQAWITLTGNAAFAGCTASDSCKLYGYSGMDANTSGCVNGANQRTITCKAGYVVTGTTNASIALTGNAPFVGCSLADNCKLYGLSGKDANTAGCVNGANQRTITCGPGHFVNGKPPDRSVTLTGNTPFLGCAKPDCGPGKNCGAGK